MNSIWSHTCEIPERRHLSDNIRSEVAVIGAGMAGVLIADALQTAGFRVVVLEADRIASGQTRNTTAKITSQHGLFYRKLTQTLDEQRARQYAAANEAAVEEFRRMIADRGIDCDFEEQNNYVYGSDTEALRAEADCAERLGLPAAFVQDTALPFPAAGAVRFAHQAQFHPLKFLRAVADGLTIFENSPVLRVDEHRLDTDRGSVTADHIVFAGHYPFVNFPGLYFARMHQERSYVIALSDAASMDGMWIYAEGEEHQYSFRRWGSLLLLGGGSHRCGENSAGGKYDELRRKAQAWFPGCREAAHWSAQDCVTPDSVPYIGAYAASRPYWHVATGFKKWGMTSSMVSAMLLRDRISGKANPNAEVFDPGRFSGGTLPGLAAEGGHAVKGLTKRLFLIPDRQAETLAPGHGGVVMYKGRKMGVYKDDDGRLYPISRRCPHLGCQLEWNPDERSWDCPCHGSRFDRYGELISGPAQTDATTGD